MGSDPARGCVLRGTSHGFYGSHHSATNLKMPHDKGAGQYVCIEATGAGCLGGCNGANSGSPPKSFLSQTPSTCEGDLVCI